MARRADARTLLFEKIRTTPPKFVHVTGVPYTVEVEQSDDPLRVDHVWITLEVPPFGRVRASINTISRFNRDAGFDARVRVGIVPGTWEEKPENGLLEEPGQDYAMIEAALPIARGQGENRGARGSLGRTLRAGPPRRSPNPQPPRELRRHPRSQGPGRRAETLLRRQHDGAVPVQILRTAVAAVSSASDRRRKRPVRHNSCEQIT
jgi:hypothetical protein